MTKIVRLHARSIFDSRGNPTVEADIFLSSGVMGRFSTPSGASCGSKEALELRDHAQAFLGKGVEKAVSNINQEIRAALEGKTFIEQKDLDACLIALDGTANKSRLGANAILAVSGAFFHALANERHQPLYGQGTLLPRPLVNVINGGSHANNGLDVQEFMIVPKAARFSDALRMVAEIFYALKSLLNDKGLSTAVGDEGGFAPAFATNEMALDVLLKASEKAGYRAGEEVFFALDVAASEFFIAKENIYKLKNQQADRAALLQWYETLVKKYPLISIEDPFHEDDYQGFSAITEILGKRVQIVGDDLFVTNPKLIKEGIEKKWATAVLIKMNQIGTISETLEAITVAQQAGLNTIISHRSGETEDTTLADLAVLTNAGQIKTGSMSRSERIAKYNRLLRIEEELGDKAQFFC